MNALKLAGKQVKSFADPKIELLMRTGPLFIIVGMVAFILTGGFFFVHWMNSTFPDHDEKSFFATKVGLPFPLYLREVYNDEKGIHNTYWRIEGKKWYIFKCFTDKDGHTEHGLRGSGSGNVSESRLKHLSEMLVSSKNTWRAILPGTEYNIGNTRHDFHSYTLSYSNREIIFRSAPLHKEGLLKDHLTYWGLREEPHRAKQVRRFAEMANAVVETCRR